MDIGISESCKLTSSQHQRDNRKSSGRPVHSLVGADGKDVAFVSQANNQTQNTRRQRQNLPHSHRQTFHFLLVRRKGGVFPRAHLLRLEIWVVPMCMTFATLVAEVMLLS